MRLGKRDNTAGVAQAGGKAVSYELTMADRLRRSERRAWWVAGTAVLMALVLAGGYWAVMPLKEKVPYLVLADAYTGNATMARLHEDSIAASEALNRANVATFIRARESYDWTMIGARDWNTVFTMAEPQVSSSYRALYSSRNPNSPLQVYGKNQAIRIKILSIQLFGGDPKKGPSGATVRYQRNLFDKNSGGSQFIDNKIATLEYVYKTNLAMSEEDRLLNPLGFRVAAYRVDNDYSTTPAVGKEPIGPVAMTAPTDADAAVPANLPDLDLPPDAAIPPNPRAPAP